MSATAADGASYWLRWQVFVCAALIALPAAVVAALLPRLRRTAAPLRATDLWVPCWARLHPGWLLGYRAFALAAAAALLVRLLVAHGLAVFYFYTQYSSSSSYLRLITTNSLDKHRSHRSYKHIFLGCVPLRCGRN